MHIIVCFKWVIDEAYIRRGAGGTLDFSQVDCKLSDYDRNAIEEAVRIRGIVGGKVTGLTVGPPEGAKGVKDALSRGLDEAVFITDGTFRDLDATQTSLVLAEVIRHRLSPYDLILCGEGSGDFYNRQVGPRLAELLEVPCLSFVARLTVTDNAVTAERRGEGGVEVVSAPLPALVTVLPEINTPRIPGVKDTLMAGKKPVITIGAGEVPAPGEPRVKTLSLTGAALERVCEKFGTDDGEIQRFIDTLRRKGVLT
ncbi:MAG: electron transfer flavoprotein subunit beta/FixA family protein [Syntrophales bacterium]|nr:electron transfer flavoprotein subunit beta/FixA family protein [Syntrophales bacterium]